MEAEAVSDVVPVGPGTTATVRTASCRRPVLADTVVARPGTIVDLVEAPAGSLVVIAAPAGYGKTIIAAQWDLADPRPFAWVSLDALDDDAAHLVAHVATALADRALLDTEDLRFLSGPGRSPLVDLVPTLLEILDHTEPFVLLVDDVHLLHDPEAMAVLAAMVDGAPAEGVLALLSRTAPAVGLARHRLRGHVVELGPADLALGLDEAREVFRGLGVSIDEERLVDVVERCEGWAGGVHLAALALRDREQSPTAAPVTGRNRLLADYLVEEVLGGLDDNTARFLEEASTLEPMSAPLLDAVLGRTDSGRRLADIEASGNLFLVPLDDERHLFRFHHLFGELLTARLRRADPVRFEVLHLQASEHFASAGDTDRAIHHALAADDRRRAAALVQRGAVALAFAGRASTLNRRLALLEVEDWLETPEGALAVAWNATTEADLSLLRLSVGAALAADDGSALADGTRSVPVAVALLAAMIGECGLEGILRNTATVIDAGPPESNPWWGMATCLRATALVHLGRHDEARRAFLASVPALHRTPGFEAGALVYLGLLQLREGDLGGAVAYTDAGWVIADHHQLTGLLPLLVIYAGDALICARAGRTQRAAESAAYAAESLARLGDSSPRTAVYGHLLLAQAHHALHDGAEARRHAAEASRVLRRHPISEELRRMSVEMEGLLSAGPLGSDLTITPLTAAERRFLPHLATHLSLPQIADELHVSRNTVKTHCVAVYRKLGVTSRTDAVAEARRLGLIDA
jgi:LuxR family maltose regulon positive regulatory protein